MLEEYRQLIIIAHVLGMSVGLGAATTSDILFFKFIKDFKISEREASILKTMSGIIWSALIIIIITGVGIYLPLAGQYNESAKFLAKMVIVLILIINGIILNLSVSPQLIKISFRGYHKHERGELMYLHRLAFALGSISIISWYSAFILGSLREAPFGLHLNQLLGIYGALLVAGIIISQIVELKIRKNAQKAKG